MQDIGLLINGNKPYALQLACELKALLNEQGLCYREYTFLKGNDSEEPSTDFFKDKSLVISIGGDGTLLAALRHCVEFDVPVLGINGGRKGFLIEIAKDDIKEAVKRLQYEDFFIEERQMLSANVYDSEDHIIAQHELAMNDFSVSRQGHARMLQMEIMINDELAEHIDADGVLLSSPTGSTAYSLSAGGPVVMPGVACTLITPICAHSLHTRPLVVPDTVRIRVNARDRLNDVLLTIDGQRSIEVPPGGYIIATKAPKCAKFVRFEKQNYYKKYRDKMIQWSMI